MQAEIPLASKPIFDGKVVSLRVDTVRLPDGREATREVVGHQPVVVVIPIDSNNNVILVRQYRYPVGAALLEAPAGGVEGSEQLQDCAQRELQEEVGHKARSMKDIGRFWASPGISTELIHAYVARDLVPSQLEPDPDENIVIERYPLSRVAGLIREGEIQDGKTIAALLILTCVLEQD